MNYVLVINSNRFGPVPIFFCSPAWFELAADGLLLIWLISDSNRSTLNNNKISCWGLGWTLRWISVEFVRPRPKGFRRNLYLASPFLLLKDGLDFEANGFVVGLVKSGQGLGLFFWKFFFDRNWLCRIFFFLVTSVTIWDISRT